MTELQYVKEHLKRFGFITDSRQLDLITEVEYEGAIFKVQEVNIGLIMIDGNQAKMDKEVLRIVLEAKGVLEKSPV